LCLLLGSLNIPIGLEQHPQRVGEQTKGRGVVIVRVIVIGVGVGVGVEV
jgi:hypothetical protein